MTMSFPLGFACWVCIGLYLSFHISRVYDSMSPWFRNPGVYLCVYVGALGFTIWFWVTMV